MSVFFSSDFDDYKVEPSAYRFPKQENDVGTSFCRNGNWDDTVVVKALHQVVYDGGQRHGDGQIIVAVGSKVRVPAEVADYIVRAGTGEIVA